MVMIRKGAVTLADISLGNYCQLYIYYYKSGKIRTYWIQRNATKDRIRGIAFGKAHRHLIAAKRLKLTRELKINGCAICGYNKCDDALDFHHVNPKDKKFALVKSNMERANKSIAEELNKCILLCSNCHREIHAKERENER